jgi:DNA-binding transcriptional regulator YdaS (Cro superfamily)
VKYTLGMSDGADIIDKLGGTTKVAEGLGINPPVVSNWRERGIPPKRWPAILGLAKRNKVKGVTLDRLARAGTPERAA